MERSLRLWTWQSLRNLVSRIPTPTDFSVQQIKECWVYVLLDSEPEALAIAWVLTC